MAGRYLATELQDDNGDIIYPHTEADIVFASDGTTIEENLSGEVTSEDMQEIFSNTQPQTGNKLSVKEKIKKAFKKYQALLEMKILDTVEEVEANTDEGYLMGARAGAELINDLGGCSFETKEDGAYVKYTLPGGADPVLKKLGSGTIKKFVADQLEYTYRGLYQFSYNLKESYNDYDKITVKDIFGGIHSVSAGSISANVERVGSASFGDIINYDPETGIINATVNIGTGTNHTIVRVTPCFYIVV